MTTRNDQTSGTGRREAKPPEAAGATSVLPLPQGVEPSIRKAAADDASATETIAKLRDLIAGPFHRVSEARFVEILNILTEQDDHTTKKIDDVRQRIADNAAAVKAAERLCRELEVRFERTVKKIESETGEHRDAMTAEFMALRQELEQKFQIFSGDISQKAQAVLATGRRELDQFREAVGRQVAEAETIAVKTQSATMSAVEQRIAQWRAEIDDDRRNDLEEVAGSLVDIGHRLLRLRQENA